MKLNKKGLFILILIDCLLAFYVSISFRENNLNYAMTKVSDLWEYEEENTLFSQFIYGNCASNVDFSSLFNEDSVQTIELLKKYSKDDYNYYFALVLPNDGMRGYIPVRKVPISRRAKCLLELIKDFTIDPHDLCTSCGIMNENGYEKYIHWNKNRMNLDEGIIKSKN